MMPNIANVTYRTLLYALPALLALLIFGGLAPQAQAQRKTRLGPVPPSQIKQIKKSRKSFELCRRDAFAQLTTGALNRKTFAIALSRCNESFPGASLYVACKKTTLKQAKDQLGAANAPAKAAKECRRYLLAASYDPRESIPFFVDKGQLYFAGIGMNRVTPLARLSPPNFECSKVKAAAQDLNQAQYVLFGNHPRTFASLTKLSQSTLMKTLRFNPNQKSAATEVKTIPGFGRVYGDPTDADAIAFFPTASCDFDADSGEIFAGLNAFYLFDGESKGATPYFGIAYYKQEQDDVTTAKVVASMLRELGPNYKSYKKNFQVTFIAAAPISETDEDQDPKNLCRSPRHHRFVGVVQGQASSPSRPAFALIANVKNLCDFGDKRAKKLSASRSN